METLRVTVQLQFNPRQAGSEAERRPSWANHPLIQN
jgi:hypothetical protein